MNGNLYVMIGIPGSGKSTFCKKNMSDKEYISRDNIRFSIISETDAYFSKEKEVFIKFIKEIEEKLLEGKDVVADATHLNINSRKKLLNALSIKPKKIFGIYLNTPFEVALERNRKRTGRAYVPEEQIESMYNHFEKPSLKEGFDAIYTIDENGNVVNEEKGRWF